MNAMNAKVKIFPEINPFQKLAHVAANVNRHFCYFAVVAVLMTAWALSWPLFELSDWIKTNNEK